MLAEMFCNDIIYTLDVLNIIVNDQKHNQGTQSLNRHAALLDNLFKSYEIGINHYIIHLSENACILHVPFHSLHLVIIQKITGLN
jgi:hypothetical protein